ncbi:MAG: phosphotransferase [Streptomyces sp.]|nr:phosphotransferase [Streptomyces sp.]NUS83882.1 phosphotransferase [Streptomyces sp.]
MPDPGTSAARVVALRSLLADVYSASVAVERWERLEPWAVARVRLRSAAAPPSVVVKWTEGGHVQARTAVWRVRTELAALQFLRDDVGVGLAPRLIAADVAAGHLVLEDLAPRTALDQLLRRDGAAAHGERLAAFAQARGELNAATAGRAEAYYARRARLGPVDRGDDRAGRFASYRDTGIEHAVALGAPLEGRAATELAAAVAELRAPGPFLALSNGDTEANNVLLHPSGPPDARLIDFEFAGYTHALTDAVCLHVPGPAWMSVGDPVATGLADHYRRALARGIPAAEDDRRYGFGLAAACVSWALIRLQRFALVDTRPPGHPSRPQLIATLEAAARTARTHRALPHLTAWVQRIAALLRERWPDADQDFTDPVRFPPYQPRR